MSDVSCLWLGKPLGNYQTLSLLSFLSRGYSVSLYTYDSGFAAPAGVDVRDAREILNSKRVFENQREKGTWAAFSNIFRYHLISQVDTTWIDTDVLALHNPLPSVNGYVLGWEGQRSVNGAVLAAPKGSRFLQFIRREADSTHPENIMWGDLGPKLITKAVTLYGLEESVQEQQIFYPLPWIETWKLLDPKETENLDECFQESAAVHWWNEVFRRSSSPLSLLAPPKGSFMGRAFREMGMSLSGREVIPANWARRVWRKEIAGRGQRIRRKLSSFAPQVVSRRRGRGEG